MECCHFLHHGSLKGIMLSEIRQRKTNNKISLTCGVFKGEKIKNQAQRYSAKIGGSQRQGVGGWQNGWRSQKAQTCSHKINESWGWKHSTATIVRNAALHFWKFRRDWVDLTSSHHENNFGNYVWWQVLTRCILAVIFQMYANIESLCSAPDTQFKELRCNDRILHSC